MLFIEAEEIDGTAYRWILDADVLVEMFALLGEPETIRL